MMDNNHGYPRTLIVGVHFSEQSGPGTFLGRLFSAWPKDRLATISGATEPPDWRWCQRHYRTGELKFPLQGLSRLLVPDGCIGPMSPSASVVAPVRCASISQKVSLLHRLARYPWRLFLRLLGGADILYCSRPSPQLLAWVREFQPEVIYGHCSGLNSVLFLRRMQQELRLPLVLHVMDDRPGNEYREGWVGKLVRPRYLAEFKELIRSADVVIAVCQEMAKEYEKRYQRPILWLSMPAELDSYRAVARIQWEAGRPFLLQFGGRVGGLALRESLADLAEAVCVLRRQGMDVVFNVLTFQPEQVSDAWRALNGVFVQSAVPPTELACLQVKADALVICLDFDPKSIREAQYSMPSKMAGCMASGTPILVYGPAGSPVVEYARREGWGKVVDRRDPVALRAAICELMDSMVLREQLGQTAKRLAVECHDAKMVSEKLRTILQKAVRNTFA